MLVLAQAIKTSAVVAFYLVLFLLGLFHARVVLRLVRREQRLSMPTNKEQRSEARPRFFLRLLETQVLLSVGRVLAKVDCCLKTLVRVQKFEAELIIRKF